MTLDPVTPVRSFIEEPTVETGWLALTNDLTIPDWTVAVVLLLVLLVATLLFYGSWPWRPKQPDLDIVRAIDALPSLAPRLPRPQ